MPLKRAFGKPTWYLCAWTVTKARRYHATVRRGTSALWSRSGHRGTTWTFQRPAPKVPSGSGPPTTQVGPEGRKEQNSESCSRGRRLFGNQIRRAAALRPTSCYNTGPRCRSFQFFSLKTICCQQCGPRRRQFPKIGSLKATSCQKCAPVLRICIPQGHLLPNVGTNKGQIR